MSLSEAESARVPALNQTPRELLPNRNPLRASVLQPVRHRLSEVALWATIEALCALGVLVWGLSDLPRERSLNLRVCQVCLIVFSVALLDSGARWFQLVRSLDWNGSLQTIQDTLVQLRAHRARQMEWYCNRSGPIIMSATLLYCAQVQEWVGSKAGQLDPLLVSLLLASTAMQAIQMAKTPRDFTNPATSNQPFWERLLDGGSVTAIEGAVRECESGDQLAHVTPSIRPDAIPNPTDEASPAPSRHDAAQEIR